MTNITRLHHALPLSPAINKAVTELDGAIADQRPHLTITAADGVHVLPCDLVRSVIAGDKPSAILTEPVLRRIIEEWLERISSSRYSKLLAIPDTPHPNL